MKIYMLLCFVLLLSFPLAEFANTPSINYNKVKRKSNEIGNYPQPNNIAPILTATGTQIYCPQSTMNIVTDFSITDPDDTAITALYVQISSGYNAQTDLLTLTGIHPNVTVNWNAISGKLELKSPTNVPVLYSDMVFAIKNIVYSNSSSLPTGNRAFSITIGQNNFLPLNGHYYQYVSNVGVGWGEAKIAAETSTYYGLQGYLVTITSADEQQLVGEQSLGTGWIAGSDVDLEGVWKWKSGPENGISFFQNLVTTIGGGYYSDPTNPGYAPVFAYWNRTGQYYEPNNAGGDEDYAHITAPGIGLRGSWNDAEYYASPAGDYQSKGYIVEYGGMPNDPIINIAAFTKMTIPQIIKTIPSERCGSGIINLAAESNLGIVQWYDTEFGGTPIYIGNNFITPILTASKNYWVETNFSNCAIKSLRTEIIATVNNIPVITSTASQVFLCGEGLASISANASEGIIHWFETATGNTLFAIGNTISRNFTQNVTYYAEAVNTVCTNGARLAINVVVHKLPIVADQTQILCKGQKTTLDAKFPNAIYLWSNGATTQTTDVFAAGKYTVAVTTAPPENCTNINSVIVVERTVSPIKAVDVNDTTITIVLENPNLQSEYSLDGLNFQASNVFENVAGGVQFAYVRDTDSCGISDKFTFLVLEIPKFFTPNGDSYNDFWSIVGLSNFPQAEVQIFDRFGKLISILNVSKSAWDGNFNGNALPSDDYWYVLKTEKDSELLKGHFTLKR